MSISPLPWRRFLPLAALVLAAAAAFLLLRDQLTFEALRDHRATLLALREARPVVAAALFVAAYATVVALSLPGAALASLTGGFLFGVFPGTLYNVGAATLGALAVFGAVRMGLGAGWRDRLDHADGAVRSLVAGLRANEVPVLLSMRLIPAIPFFLANLVPAVLGVAPWRFAWTTFVGILPGGLVYTWVGAGLGEVFDRGETPDLTLLREPQVIGPLAALGLLALVPVAVRVLRRG